MLNGENARAVSFFIDTSMNVDPVDDCTFWYVNEYYAVSGTPADGRPWQTRIASFKLPGC